MHPSVPQPLVVSLGALVLVNTIPVVGVLYWDWRIFDILVLFWAENLIIGAINVLRMGTLLITQQALGALFMIPFFTVHYGGFCLGHGFFLFMLFGDPMAMAGVAPPGAAIESLQVGTLALPIAALAASHVVSFVVNFLWAGEYRGASLDTLMFLPYPRIVVLHVVIIFGGFVIAAAGQPLPALILLIVLKTILDAGAHYREHRALQSARAHA